MELTADWNRHARLALTDRLAASDAGSSRVSRGSISCDVRRLLAGSGERASGWCSSTAPGPTLEGAATASIAEKIGCAAETFRYWVRQIERDGGRRPGLTTDERTRSSSSSARTPSGGGRMKSCVPRPHVSRRRSSMNVSLTSLGGRCPPRRCWRSTPSARSCLPTVHYERKARIRDPQRQPARVQRNAATLVEHIARVWGAPGGLRSPEDLEAAAA
jgi:hypothetical protein